MVHFTVPTGQQRAVFLEYTLTQRQAQSFGTGFIQDHAKILELDTGGSPRLKVTLQHPLAVLLENLAARKSAHQCLSHLVGSGTAFCSQQQGFGHRPNGNPDNGLIGQFGELATAHRTNVGHLSHGVKDVSGLYERLIRAPHHDGKGTRFCTAGAPGHRCIQILATLLFHPCRMPSSRTRLHRTHIDHQRSLTQAGNGATVIQHLIDY